MRSNNLVGMCGHPLRELVRGPRDARVRKVRCVKCRWERPANTPEAECARYILDGPLRAWGNLSVI